jgi:phytoene synthase
MLRYPIPKLALLELVEGGLWDVERSRYGSWSELREYCLRVAGAVGVACTAVYGPSDPERAVPLAQTLGVALQQINIMRDVSEDLGLGRVYLPQDELFAFGVTEGDLAAERATPAFRSLMEHQGARARGHLVQGIGLVALLDRRSALCVRALAGVYEALLVDIERAGYEVLGTRRRVTAARKLGVAGAAMAAELTRGVRRG